MSQPDPARIMETALGFLASKTLLSAVELGVFSELANGALSGPELQARIGLHPRATLDFLDALVALGFLGRNGNGPDALYRNTPDADHFLDRAKPSYMGGFLEMANARLYRFWADLSEGLRTGKPQNEIKLSGAPVFEELYSDEARLEQFIEAMGAISRPNFDALARKFDFSRYRTLCDVGGANAQLSRSVAARHPLLRCISLDLPKVKPIADRCIERDGLQGRVNAGVIDFFADPVPFADVITMGMVLHDWNLENKMHLIRSAHRALEPGGVFIAVENLIDDERRENAFGLLMSLNMLIELGDGFDFTGADFTRWCLDAGFARTEILPLQGPCSAAIAYR